MTKRIVSLLLSVLIIAGSVPAGYIFKSLALENTGDKNTLSVGYYDGMTVEDFVGILNSGTGLPSDTPVHEWEWFTKGDADYSYGRYLVDVEVSKNAFFDGISKKDVDVLKALEVYDRYEAGEITKEEVADYSEAAQIMFFDINIDADELRRAVSDAIRSSERSFRANGKYVSLNGQTLEVTKKKIELDYKNDAHCVYKYTIVTGDMLPDYEGTLYLPTTLEVNGSESYPSVIDALSKGKTLTVRHGEDVYTVDVFGVERSELVLKPSDGNVYFIPFNKAAGDGETDILSRIYSEVVDFEKSILSPDFDSETKNGFTVRFYDGRTGWYEFSSDEDRLETGRVYEIEIIYSGITTVSEEFSVALYDPRRAPAVAFYDSETLVAEYGDLDSIKQAVFSTLVDLSDLPGVSYSDFEYYYYVGDLSKILDRKAFDSFASSDSFEKFIDKIYDKVWSKVESSISENSILKDIDKGKFKEDYFNIDYLKKCLVINDWILFDGQSYPICVEIEGEIVELFSIDIPSVIAGTDYRIKVEYKGNEDTLPAEAVSGIKNLHILRRSSEIEINDGVYEPGKLEGLVSEKNGLDCILVAVRVDTDYLEMNNIYIQLPESLYELSTVRVGKDSIDLLSELIDVSSANELTPRKIRNYLDKLDEDSDSQTIDKIIRRIDKILEILPEGLIDAPISLSGIPQNTDGIYLVGAITADLNSVPNYDYGVIGVCESIYDNIIMFDYEIPENEPISIGEQFDFGAHIFTSDLEPVEDELPRYCFIGYESGRKEIYFSNEAPSEKGQYLQIAVSNCSAPAFRFFDIGLMSVEIAPSDSEYEYDGKPHGEPVITDSDGNILQLRGSDEVIYTNIVTGETHSYAPSAVGNYFVEVYYAGDSNHKRATAQYEFSIVPVKVNLWISDYSSVYGNKLPDFVIECDIPELLDGIVYTVTPEVSYRGEVGTYRLIINIQSMPEGYLAVKTSGQLTVTPRPVTIQMGNITLTYGDDYDPNGSVYYNVVEGELLEGDELGLVFEKYSQAGTHDFSPVDYTNKNYALAVIPGKITIEPKVIDQLRIEDEFIYEGDELPEFTLTGDCPEDLVVHIAPAFYDGTPGTYSIIGVCEENPNYKVYIEEGILTVRRRPAKEITVTIPDQEITFGDPLPKFTYTTSEDVKGVRFSVSVIDYDGNAGVYSLSVSTSAYDGKDYRFTYNIGKLTVKKKALDITVSDYTNTYGNVFDPQTEYKFETSDSSIDLSEILKNYKIAAELYDGEAGSYLLIGKADADNYEITVKNGTLTILPKLIKVTPGEGQGKTEGDEDGVIEYIAYGLIGDDELSGALSREPGEQVGLYLITHGTLANKNYKIELDEEYYAIRSAKYEDVVISSLPDKLVYLEGEEFDPAGLEVKAIFKDGSEIILTLGKDYTVEGFNTAKPGTQKLRIYFEGYVNTFNVEVKESAVILVKIDNFPTKLDYIEGQEFDPDGMSAVVFFDNGTHRIVTAEDLEFTGFDTNKLGVQTVSVSFRGVSDSFDVNVVAKKLVGIEVDASEATTEYYDGDTFSSEGIKVYKVYDSGIREFIPEGEYTVSEPSTKTEGEKTVTVKYQGFTAEYTVSVTKRSVADLELVYEGDMISCVTNGEFNHKAIVVTAHFDNGTEKVLSYGEYTVDNFSSEKIGIYNCSISYGGVSKNILVKIEASVMESIEITKLPGKLIYTKGESFDDSGMVVHSIFTNGDKKLVDEYTFSGFDTNKLGRQTVTVKYLGFTAQFSVYLFDESFNGIRVNKLPEKTRFVEKTSFSYDGIEVVFDTNDGVFVIPEEDITVETPDMTETGKHDIAVKYADSSCTYEIEIVEKTAVSLSVNSCPEVFVCIKGEIPNAANSVMTVTYDNGEVENVTLTSDMFGAYDSDKLGYQNATITYETAQTDCAVWVVRARVASVKITRLPYKLTYPIRSEFDATGLEVLVGYEDGVYEAFDATGCLITGVDMQTVSVNNVVVRFADHTDEFEISVVPRELDRIVIAEYPNTEYVEGQYFAVDGMVVYAYYNNGEYEMLDPSDYSVNAPDGILSVGEYTVSIDYSGLTTQFTVNVEEIKAIGIRVDESFGKTKYHQDNIFESFGFRVYIVYNDGSEIEIDISDCEIEGFDTSEVGQCIVTIVYGEFSDEFEITVLSSDSAVKAELVVMNMPLETIQGTPHEFSLLRVRILYSDGSYGYISSDVYEVKDYDYTAYGEYNAKIVYNKFALPITLTVISCNVSIEIENEPAQKDYLVGDKLDASGIKVLVVKSDGTKEEISDFEFEYDFSDAGKAIVTVKAFGFKTEFEVNVYGYGIEDILPGEGQNKYYSQGGYIISDDFGNVTTFGEFKQSMVCGQFISADIDDDDLIYTGLVIAVVSDDKVYAQYTVVVKGDLNADGKTNVSDVVISRRALSGWENLDEIQEIAADVTENNGFNITDVVMMVRYAETLV